MVKVNLLGGLGNQLFQYYAGLALAGGDPTRLKVDTTFSKFGRTGHSVLISDLGLPGEFVGPASDNKAVLAAAIIRRQLGTRLGRHPQGLSKFTGGAKWLSSDVIGYDPMLESTKLTSSASLWGYFQTWRYSEKLLGNMEFPRPRIESPTAWYLAQLRVQRNEKTLTLHVRRGDYENESAKFGLLSTKYYSDAINHLRDKGALWNQVWLYTDQPNEVAEEFAGLIAREEIRIVKPDSNSHPGESLLAISEADYIIIGNSSFSWWAAFLSTRVETVVRPGKWFRGMNDPSDLFPEDWEPVDSTWEDWGSG